MNIRQLIFAFCLISWHSSAQGLSGTTGLFNIPVGRIPEDRTFIAGAHFLDRHYGGYKYTRDPDFQWDALATFATLVFLPRVELQFRYTHLLGRKINQETKYFPDRMATVRVQALRERRWVPAVTVGLQDFAGMLSAFSLSSPSYYAANYVVASKKQALGPCVMDLTFGYGGQLRRVAKVQLDGAFGGLAIGWKGLPGTDFIVEYDSRHWNIAGRVLLFKRLQLLAGWYNLKAFSGGLSWRNRIGR